MANPIPDRDLDFRVFVTDFHNVASGNLTVLGITSAELTSLYDDLQAYDTSLAEVSAKRLEAKAKVDLKNVDKETLRENLAGLIRTIRSRDVPSALLTNLGIGPVDPNHPVQPEQPGMLTVTPYTNGTNWVRWQRGTNKRATQYVVQVKNAETDGFVYLANTSKLSYKHLGQQPGFQQTYRVYAIRNGQQGVPSNVFTVYEPDAIGEVVQLKVA